MSTEFKERGPKAEQGEHVEPTGYRKEAGTTYSEEKVNQEHLADLKERVDGLPREILDGPLDNVKSTNDAAKALHYLWHSHMENAGEWAAGALAMTALIAQGSYDPAAMNNAIDVHNHHRALHENSEPRTGNAAPLDGDTFAHAKENMMIVQAAESVAGSPAATKRHEPEAV